MWRQLYKAVYWVSEGCIGWDLIFKIYSMYITLVYSRNIIMLHVFLLNKQVLDVRRPIIWRQSWIDVEFFGFSQDFIHSIMNWRWNILTTEEQANWRQPTRFRYFKFCLTSTNDTSVFFIYKKPLTNVNSTLYYNILSWLF